MQGSNMSEKKLNKAPWWFLFLGTPLLSFYIWQVLVQMENVAARGCQHSQLLSHRTVDMKYEHTNLLDPWNSARLNANIW